MNPLLPVAAIIAIGMVALGMVDTSTMLIAAILAPIVILAARVIPR